MRLQYDKAKNETYWLKVKNIFDSNAFHKYVLQGNETQGCYWQGIWNTSMLYMGHLFFVVDNCFDFKYSQTRL